MRSRIALILLFSAPALAQAAPRLTCLGEDATDQLRVTAEVASDDRLDAVVKEILLERNGRHSAAPEETERLGTVIATRGRAFVLDLQGARLTLILPAGLRSRRETFDARATLDDGMMSVAQTLRCRVR